MRSGSTGSYQTHIGTLCPELDSDLPRRHISDEVGDKKGGNLAPGTFKEQPMIPFYGLNPTHGSPQRHTNPVSIRRADNKPGIIYCHPGSSQRKVDKPVSPSHQLSGNKVGWIKPFNLTGDSGPETGSIKPADDANTGLSLA